MTTSDGTVVIRRQERARVWVLMIQGGKLASIKTYFYMQGAVTVKMLEYHPGEN